MGPVRGDLGPFTQNGSRTRRRRWGRPGRLGLASALAFALLAPAEPAAQQVGTDARVDTGPAGLSTSTVPRITGTGDDALHMVWQDYRDPEWAIYYRRARNFGATLNTSDVKLSTAGNASAPEIATDGIAHLYAVWHKFNGDTERIRFARSVDAGTTWSVPVTLNTPSGYASEPEICADDGGRVFVVWAQNNGLQDQVYLVASADWGASFTNQMVVNSTPLGHSEGPRVACDGTGKAYVAYLDRRFGEHDVFTRSWVAGFGFGPDQLIESVDDPASGVQIVADKAGGSGLVMVAWVSFSTSGSALETCLYSNWSLDHGLNYQPSEVAVSGACSPPPGGTVPLFLEVDLETTHDASTSTTRVHALYGRVDLPPAALPTPTLVLSNVFTASALGQAWGTEMQLSQGGAPYPEKGIVFALPRAQVTADVNDPDKLFATWMHADPGFGVWFDIQACWSVDAGANWTLPVSITTKPAGPGTSRSAYPQLWSRERRAAVVWDDRRSWTLPENLPPGDPHVGQVPIGAPDIYMNVIDLTQR